MDELKLTKDEKGWKVTTIINDIPTEKVVESKYDINALVLDFTKVV